MHKERGDGGKKRWREQERKKNEVSRIKCRSKKRGESSTMEVVGVKEGSEKGNEEREEEKENEKLRE